LCDVGADINATNSLKQNVLITAVKYKNKDAFKWLLENKIFSGSLFNNCDNDGANVWHYVANARDLFYLDTLLAYHKKHDFTFDVDVIGKNGLTPYAFALKNVVDEAYYLQEDKGFVATLEKLITCGAKMDFVADLSQSEQPKPANFLSRLFNKVEEPPVLRVSAPHLLVACDDITLWNLFCERVKPQDIQSLLYYAVACGSSVIVDAILSKDTQKYNIKPEILEPYFKKILPLERAQKTCFVLQKFGVNAQNMQKMLIHRLELDIYQ